MRTLGRRTPMECGPPILLNDLPARRRPTYLSSGHEAGKRNTDPKRRPVKPAPGRAVSAPGACSPALLGLPFERPPDLFAVYNTVYNTVLLVLPFLRPTVTVTRFPRPPERDCPVTHYAISDDGNGAR